MLAHKNIKKLGIIAGSGKLPLEVINLLSGSPIEFFVVVVEGEPSDRLYTDIPHCFHNISSVGKVLKEFKKRKIEDVMLLGKVSRPNFSALKPDIDGIRLLTKLAKNSKSGDNSIFDEILSFLAGEGFKVHGVKDFASDLLVSDGLLTKAKPAKKVLADIEMGIDILDKMSELDIGQAIIVHNGLVLGVEAAEGTDKLIERCSRYRKEDKGGVLIKRKKNKQDERIDLPTIGVNTIFLLKKHGFSGVALQANECLMLEKEELVNKADESGVFVVGV